LTYAVYPDAERAAYCTYFLRPSITSGILLRYIFEFKGEIHVYVFSLRITVIFDTLIIKGTKEHAQKTMLRVTDRVWFSRL